VFLLDANMASAAMRGHPAVVKRLRWRARDEICISAVTEGELRFGAWKRGYSTRLAREVAELLAQVTVLPWRSEEAEVYGRLRAEQEGGGLSLGLMDLLLAAHAVSENAVLVSDDRVFARVPELRWENWLEPPG